MKRCVLLWVLALGVGVAAGGSFAQMAMVAGGDPVEGWWHLKFFEDTEHEREFEIERPLDDWMSGYWNRWSAPDISVTARTELAVTPADPSPSDEVTLEVSCWMPASNYRVDQADLQVRGRQITLTLTWVNQGIGFQAFNWRKHSESLGKLDPGLYVVHVSNKGAASGNASMSFRVSAPSQVP